MSDEPSGGGTRAPKYLFDHIPKTGGVTLKEIFDRVLGATNVSPTLRWRNASQAIAEFSRLTLITGHFWHAPGSLLNRPRSYLTMLRRPEDRILSLYYSLRHQPLEDDNKRVVEAAQTLTLDEFLESDEPAIVGLVRNHVVHHFKCFFLDGYSGQSDERRDLDLARLALRQYDFVGVFEAFEDSVHLMCYELGWPPVHEIPRTNATAGRRRLDEVDGDTLARLRRLNAADIELYEYAVTLFAERRRAMMKESVDRKTRPTPAGTGAASEDAAGPPVFGDRAIKILGVEVIGTSSGNDVLRAGEEAVVGIVVAADETRERLVVGISIRDVGKRTVFGTNSDFLEQTISVSAGVEYEVEFRLRMDIGEGDYSVTVGLTGGSHFDRCFHWWDDAAKFTVAGTLGPAFEGTVKLRPTLAWRESPSTNLFSATLAAVGDAVPPLEPGARTAIPLRIKNTSEGTWPASGLRAVHLAYHWLDESDGSVVVNDGLRTTLPKDVEPGEEILLDASFEAPPRPGRFRLRFSLVQELTAWFEERGVPPLDVSNIVVASTRAASERSEEAEPDREARLEHMTRLQQMLDDAAAERAVRLEHLTCLRQMLDDANSERAARLEQLARLRQMLDEAHADRAAGLEHLTRLQQMLEDANRGVLARMVAGWRKRWRNRAT
jgi:hypothetical protein